MPFEKKVVARAATSIPLITNPDGSLSIPTDELERWEGGLNSLSAWQLVCVVEVAGTVIAFLQRETP